MSNSTPFYAEYGITTADEFRAAINEKAPIKLEPTSGQATELDASTIAYCDSWLRVVFKGEDKQFIFDESNGWSIAEVKRESSGGGEKELPTPASTDAGKLVGVGETGDYEMIDAVYGVKPKETLVADITTVEDQNEYPAPGLDGIEFEDGQEVPIKHVATYQEGTHEETCTYVYQITQKFEGEDWEELVTDDYRVNVSYSRELGTEHWICLFAGEVPEGIEVQSYLLSGGQKIPNEYLEIALPSTEDVSELSILVASPDEGRAEIFWESATDILPQYIYFGYDGTSWTAVDENGDNVLYEGSSFPFDRAIGYYNGQICKPIVQADSRRITHKYNFIKIDPSTNILTSTTVEIHIILLGSTTISGTSTNYTLTPAS